MSQAIFELATLLRSWDSQACITGPGRHREFKSLFLSLPSLGVRCSFSFEVFGAGSHCAVQAGFDVRILPLSPAPRMTGMFYNTCDLESL